jgi:hypothetical protein
MKTLVRLVAVATAAASLLAVVQRNQIISVRSKLAQLETSGSVHNSKVPASTVSLDTQEQIKRLRAENRDIYKLRGQISPAREKRKEIERMQAENAQLREQIKNIKANPQKTSPRTFPLANKGQSTPGAALETVFWSMYQGDVETLSRVMPMATLNWDTTPSQERTNNLTLMKALAATVEKLEILDRKSDSPDETHLTFRITAPDGTNLNSFFGPSKRTFVLRRTNDLWQVVAEHEE